MKRIKKLTGYTALAMFKAFNNVDLTDKEIPKRINQPYVSSPTHPVFSSNLGDLIIVETGQRKYEVFLLE